MSGIPYASSFVNEQDFWFFSRGGSSSGTEIVLEAHVEFSAWIPGSSCSPLSFDFCFPFPPSPLTLFSTTSRCDHSFVILSIMVLLVLSRLLPILLLWLLWLLFSILVDIEGSVEHAVEKSFEMWLSLAESRYFDWRTKRKERCLPSPMAFPSQTNGSFSVNLIEMSVL